MNDKATNTDLMVQLARYIEANADQKLTLNHLADWSGLSPSYLQRRFVAVFGVSPRALQDEYRMRRARQALRDNQDVTGALYDAGYGSSSRFYEKAARQLGMTPGRYRQGAAGESISYLCSPVANVDLLMLAASERGLCHAAFGNDASALLAALQAEFPRAQLRASPAGNDAQLQAWMAALAVHLEQRTPQPDLPLDLRGTAFQIRVWQFLQTIPAGRTVTYTEVAQAIGSPRAARAVASACARNRIALVVPCHRVIRGDGGMGGYRWGLERKRRLLATESALSCQDSSSSSETR